MPKLAKLAKLAPQHLRRALALALPACALSLLDGRLALAQRPTNALPPTSQPAPTDDYYRGQAPYPVEGAAPAPGEAAPDAPVQPDAQPAPPGPAPPAPDGAARPGASGDTLADFLRAEASSQALKLSQARVGWKSMRIVRSGAARAGAPGGAGSLDSADSFWNSLTTTFAGAPRVFLTQGRTIKVNGDEQLLVYQAQFPTPQATQDWFRAHMPPSQGAGVGERVTSTQFKKATRDFLNTIPMRASLVNTRQVASLEEIEPFDFQERLARFGRTIEDKMRQSQPPSARTPAAPDTSPDTSPDATPGPSDDSPGVAPVPPARIPNRNAAPPSTSPGSSPTPPDAGASEPPRAVPVPDAVAQQAASEPLRKLFAAVQRYRADNADVLPPLDDLPKAQAALAPYLSGPDAWRDPVSGKFFSPNARLSQRRMVHIRPFASSLILIYSEPDATGSRTVMRLDGVVRRVSATEWDKLNGTAGVQ